MNNGLKPNGQLIGGVLEPRAQFSWPDTSGSAVKVRALAGQMAPVVGAEFVTNRLLDSDLSHSAFCDEMQKIALTIADVAIQLEKFGTE